MIRWIANRFGYEKGAEVGGQYILPYQSGKPYMPPTRMDQLLKRYTGWVYACASKNAISASQIPLRLYAGKPSLRSKSRFKTKALKAEDKRHLAGNPGLLKFMRKAADIEELLEHPFLDLIYKANDFMNSFDLLEVMFLHQELTGQAYWHIDKDPSGRPIEIWPLYPQYVKKVVSRQKFIEGYIFSLNNVDKIAYEAEEIVDFYYTNPINPIYGFGKLQAAVVAADLSTSMNTYEVALLQNDAKPDFAIIMPAEAAVPSDSELKRMEKSWNARHGSMKRSGKAAFISGGAKLERITLSPKEMAFLKGRKATLEEIAGIFGVPMSKLTTENVNRANAESGEYQYMKDTIQPMLRRTEQKINEKLMPMFDSNIFVAFDNPVPQDKEFRLKERESNLKNGYTSINIERQKDGEDEVEWGNVPLLPSTIAPLGSEPVPEVEPVKQHKKEIQPLRQPSARHNIPYRKALESFFLKIKNDILSQVGSKAATKDIADDLASGWFDMTRWNKELADVSKPFVRATMLTGAEQAIRSVQRQFQFDSVSAGIETVMDERSGRIVDINKRIAAQLRNVIATNLVEGEPISKLKPAIREFFNVDYAKIRAERIARTETIWAFNHGAVEGYKQSRIVEAKEWVTAQDDRLCQWCAPMDGKIVGLTENYHDMGADFIGEEGGTLNLDYEDVQHPPLHPGCRCTIVPVLKEV